MAFRKLRVPGGGRFCPNGGGLNPLRQPNEGKISHKVGLADCGNDFQTRARRQPHPKSFNVWKHSGASPVWLPCTFSDIRVSDRPRGQAGAGRQWRQARVSDLHGGKRRNHHIAHRNVIKADDGDILRDAVAVFTQCTHGGRRDDVIIGKVSIRDRRFRLEKAQHVAVASSEVGETGWTYGCEVLIPFARSAL